jgi:tetratricopeptide (TPR) repeat protein
VTSSTSDGQSALGSSRDLQQSVLAIQGGVIDVQTGVVELVRNQRPDLASPIQQAAIDIQRGAVAVLKGALGLQQAAELLARTASGGLLSQSMADPVQLNALGLTLAGSDRHSDAISAFQQAIAADPSFSDAHKNLGDAYLNAGLLDRAVNAYEQAVSLRQDYREADNNMAVALLNQGDYVRAEKVLKRSLFREAGLPPKMTERFDPSLTSLVADNAPSASLFKVQDRVEQIEYLLQQELIDPSFNELLARLKAVCAELKQDKQRKPYTQLTQPQVEALGGYFDRLIHYADAPRISGPTMNDALDYKALEDKYLETRCLFFDDFLSPVALNELRRFFLQSTVFFRYSEAGFVASYVTDGFNCGLVFQLIEELHERFPRILRGRHLNNMWCYRYCSQGDGVRPHNGDGSVTINFYLTPNSANLDSEGGGMVMYDKVHPDEWDWVKYNTYKDDPSIQADIARYLADARSEKVQYRCNRAVLFHSTLFHKTDPYRFLDGYENRRMNITMLFGKRGQESAALK